MFVFRVIMVRIFPHSDRIRVRMRENADQNNSEYGHFSRSVLIDLSDMFTQVSKFCNFRCLKLKKADVWTRWLIHQIARLRALVSLQQVLWYKWVGFWLNRETRSIAKINNNYHSLFQNYARVFFNSSAFKRSAPLYMRTAKI